jgi:hypothetical protein
VCWMSDGIRYCYDPNDGKVPVPVYVPPQADGYYAPAAEAPAPAEEVLPAEPAAAGVPGPAAAPTASAGPTAVTVPSPAASPAAVVTSAAGQTGTAEPFDAVPVVLIAGGVIAVAAVAWLVPPVRRALLSLSRLE